MLVIPAITPEHGDRMPLSQLNPERPWVGNAGLGALPQFRAAPPELKNDPYIGANFNPAPAPPSLPPSVNYPSPGTPSPNYPAPGFANGYPAPGTPNNDWRTNANGGFNASDWRDNASASTPSLFQKLFGSLGDIFNHGPTLPTTPYTNNPPMYGGSGGGYGRPSGGLTASAAYRNSLGLGTVQGSVQGPPPQDAFAEFTRRAQI